jgi:hypothetical protein
MRAEAGALAAHGKTAAKTSRVRLMSDGVRSMCRALYWPALLPLRSLGGHVAVSEMVVVLCGVI